MGTWSGHTASCQRVAGWSCSGESPKRRVYGDLRGAGITKTFVGAVLWQGARADGRKGCDQTWPADSKGVGPKQERPGGSPDAPGPIAMAGQVGGLQTVLTQGPEQTGQGHFSVCANRRTHVQTDERLRDVPARVSHDPLPNFHSQGNLSIQNPSTEELDEPQGRGTP